MIERSAGTAVDALVAGVLAGDPRGLGRAIRHVDDRTPEGGALLKALFAHAGRAWVLGITGNPGAGKSTLTDRLIGAYRARGERVGVVAVDPSSPFTGGAILGDRIRMGKHTTDPGVFIRSLATRGHLGGLSRNARDVVRVLDAAGYGIVLVETAGVGQDEIEIVGTAHTTLVVMAPGLGDDVQALKAGLLECADVFVVNKADRDGADATVRDLESMVATGMAATSVKSAKAGRERGAWVPPVLKCVATTGAGTRELALACDEHRAFMTGSDAGQARRRTRAHDELVEALKLTLYETALRELGAHIDQAADEVAAGRVDPIAAAEALLAQFRLSRPLT